MITTIGFIGFGHMAKAIAKNLKLHNQFKLSAASPSLSSNNQEEGILFYNDNCDLAVGQHILMLCVKPSQLIEVLKEIAPVISPDTLIISIVAGVPLSTLATYLPKNQAIIRCMPNLGALHQKSATPLIANSHTTNTQLNLATILFDTIGITTWIQDEALLDAFTALSGSGPAYIFLMLEAMIDAAITLGIPEETAKTFTLKTVEGALCIAMSSEQSLIELQKQVTSKGGTTEAALMTFERLHFKDIIREAMSAAFLRAKQLGNTPQH